MEVFVIEPLASGLPHVRSLVRVSKKTSRGAKRNEQTRAAAETTVHFYVSNLPPQPAEIFAALVRGHWGGCEIRNHWVRDALFEEDATLSKNLNLNANLALLRCALIALKARLAPELRWPALFELAGPKPSLAYNLVFNNSFK